MPPNKPKAKASSHQSKQNTQHKTQHRTPVRTPTKTANTPPAPKKETKTRKSPHTHTQNYHTQKHTLHLIQSSLARRDHMRKFRLQQQLTYSEQKTLNLTNTTARLGQRLGQLLGRRRNVNDMRITRTYERLPPAKSLFMSSRKREYPKHIARSGRCVCVCHNQQTVVDHHYVKDTSRMRNQFSQFHVRSFQPSEINEESGSSL